MQNTCQNVVLIFFYFTDLHSIQGIARAPATGGVFGQDALTDQALDVTEGGVMRALSDLRQLRGSQLSLESIEHFIEDTAVAAP